MSASHPTVAPPRIDGASVTIPVIMAFIFLLGWPLEWVPIILIIIPILLPLVDQIEFNLARLAPQTDEACSAPFANGYPHRFAS